MGDRMKRAGRMTGIIEKDDNLLWYTHTCLDNALRLETCRQDAEGSGDTEMAELFTKAQADNRKGAELGLRMLAERMMEMARWSSAAVPVQAPSWDGRTSGGEAS